MTGTTPPGTDALRDRAVAELRAVGVAPAQGQGRLTLAQNVGFL